MAGHKKYTQIILAVLLPIICTLVLFNFIIDPFNKFGNNRLGVYTWADREHKPTELRLKRSNYSTYLLGNSKIGMIDTRSLEGFYNAGLGGATVRELCDFVELYIPEGSRVIVGFDVGQGAKQEETGSYTALKKPYSKVIQDYLLSSSTLEHSVRTIDRYFRSKYGPFFFEHGTMNLAKWLDRRDQYDPGRLEIEVGTLAQAAKLKESPTNEDLYYYEHLKEIFNKKQIKYISYFHPHHEDVLRLMREDGSSYKTYCKYKDAILKVFPQTCDYWDSEYSKREYFYNTDPVHIKSEPGKKMIGEILTLNSL